MNELLYLPLDKLRCHPKNLRRFYPEAQVREMAASIRAVGGVIQPLRIVPNGKDGCYLVVDGNIRLAGGQLLGPECPLLKCELVEESEARQWLDMAITSKIRYDPDPISEALNYQRLIDSGYTRQQIADETGINETTIANRLELLTLDQEIQELIGEGGLPRDARVCRALLTIADKSARVRLAERMAGPNASIAAIVKACAGLNQMLAEKQEAKTGAPSLVQAQKRAGMKIPKRASSSWKNVRGAAQVMCDACVVKEGQLAGVREPAWEMIAHAAQEMCGACSVGGVESVCRECPGVEMLRRLIEACSPVREANGNTGT